MEKRPEKTVITGLDLLAQSSLKRALSKMDGYAGQARV
jgi:hypothetical protein